MNALLRIGARLLPLATALTLSSCMSMSGLGGDSKYACKAPDGVTCDSVSGTYANAVANNLPSQRKRHCVRPPYHAPACRLPAGLRPRKQARRCAPWPATCACG